MKLEVLVQPGAKKDEVILLPEGRLRVRVRQRAVEGQANEAVRQLLAAYFDVPRSSVVFKRGLKSKSKLVEVLRG